MRIRRVSEPLAWLVFALAVAGTAAAADEPQKWLERMNQALTMLNYDGVFSHIQGGRVETLRIIHRVQNGDITERLVSLDGSGREFIRSGSVLTCYLPDLRTVVVQQQLQPSLLLGRLPKFDAATSQFYDIKALKRMRIIGRKARLIIVDPKDDFRYGYRLWIDEATGMPLKTQLCDGEGHVIEQVVFASIATPDRIPDSAFKPDLSTDGFRWLRQVPTPLPSNAPIYTWSALRLPPGFHISARASQVMPGSTGLVEHLVYTDGVASVSVFVESHLHAGHTPAGGAQLGSTSTFATIVDGHPITAVGEVPPQTVKFIANQMKAQPRPH
jgi:sigma-E factor negative regulatory protein RseB